MSWFSSGQDRSIPASDDWGWMFLGPMLLCQAGLFAAVVRSRTIRFQQLMLCLCGFYWVFIVYYVQYFPRGSVLFCDVSISKCSYCLNNPVSYLPGYFGLVDRSSNLNRSIADTSFIYYLAHVGYPLTCKIPIIGQYMTLLGLLVSGLVSLFCVYLASYSQELGDICIVNMMLYIINWGLSYSMYSHWHKQWSTQRRICERDKNA